MGCVASTIDKEGKVQICKERKKLMKYLLEFRGEFADAQLAYMGALKNTGITLRQFTESESLELENTHYGVALPPSPPPPLPPSPPPPPPFSPELRKFTDPIEEVDEADQEEESSEVGEDDSCTPLPPPPPPLDPNMPWGAWYTGESSSQHGQPTAEAIDRVEEEKWAETNTEFVEENQEESVVSGASSLLTKKLPSAALVNDNMSLMSWCIRDTTNMAVVPRRSKKTLEGIVEELDDYFLKASAGAKEIAVLMDISSGHTSLPFIIKENKRKRSHSAKVFSALSWSWSSKSLQFSRDSIEAGDPREPCRPGAHRITLERLYAKEKQLYKEVKDEEITKLEHGRKLLLLQKLEDENHDWTRTEKTRLGVESLQSDVLFLEQSISMTCSSILKLIDEELLPQLIAITSGLMHMWRTMYECHQVQNHISQQMNHLTNDQNMSPTTDYHRQAIVQLETEVTNWYNSFCKVVKSQREYVRTLCRWIQLTNGLVVDHQQSNCLSAVRALCEKWLLTLDKLPDKVASDAIKSFLSAIHSIFLQMVEEHGLQKRSDKLEKKLQKELYVLAEMEHKLEGSLPVGDAPSNLSPRHPLSIKRIKAEALRNRVDCEKEKYANSVQVTRAMILNNLKTTLPSVFQALMGFSSACIQAFEVIHSHDEPADSFNDGSENFNCSESNENSTELGL